MNSFEKDVDKSISLNDIKIREEDLVMKEILHK